MDGEYVFWPDLATAHYTHAIIISYQNTEQSQNTERSQTL